MLIFKLITFVLPASLVVIGIDKLVKTIKK